MEGDDTKSKVISIFFILSLITILPLTRFLLGRTSTFFFIAGADGAAIVAALSGVILRRRARLRRRENELHRLSECKDLRLEYSFLRRVAGVPTKYQYKDLQQATSNFSLMVGRGSSASVFKGTLPDGTSVAVKRLDGEEEERGEKTFISEVAAIASVHHINIAQLIGFSCPQNMPRFLVYDYICNGSLDSWIFHKSRDEHTKGCLPWEKRQSVAVDVARALSYMHHDCRKRILHLDVKPENILLDGGYRGVVSDFGLSKLLRKDESRVMTTVRGTRGYLAPEWLLEDGVSVKSDVYSFGMVVLEMVGGRRSVCWEKGGGKNGGKWEYFPKMIYDRVKEGRIMDIVDKRMRAAVKEEEVRRMVYVGLWCIQEQARRRPSMVEVVEMLEGKKKVEEPPETAMILVDLLSIDDNVAAVGRVAAPQEVGGTAAGSVAACSFATRIYSGR